MSYSSTQAVKQNQLEGVQIIWIADTTIYSDSFPVGLAYMGSIYANITFETSYTSYNISEQLDYYTKIHWIDLPKLPNGNDKLSVYAEGSLIGSYSFTWEHSQLFLSQPTYISYKNGWSSYWLGNEALAATYDSNNRFEISNNSRVNTANVSDSNFKISGDYEFDSIISKLNLTDIHKYQSWRFNDLLFITDQKSENKELIIQFAERTVKLEINYYGGSPTTVYSDPKIVDLFNTIDNITRNIVQEYGSDTETSSELPTQFVFTLLSVIIIPIIRRKIRNI